MIIRIYPCFILALVVASTSWSEVQLRYQWIVGDEWILDKQLDLSGTLQMGTHPVQLVSQRAILRKKLIVEEKLPDDWWKLRVALLSLSATKSIGEEEFRYSLSPDHLVVDDVEIWSSSIDPEKPSTLLQQYFRPLVMWCTSLGNTKSPRVMRGIREHATHSDSFSLFGIGEEGWLPLPPDPVRPGDKWKNEPEQLLKAGEGSQLTYENTFHLIQLGQVDGRLQAQIQFDRKRNLQNLNFDFIASTLDGASRMAHYEENVQHFTGRIDFLVADGQVLRCEAEGSARLRYHLTGGILFRKQPDIPEIEYDWQKVRMITTWQQVKKN